MKDLLVGLRGRNGCQQTQQRHHQGIAVGNRFVVVVDVGRLGQRAAVGQKQLDAATGETLGGIQIVLLARQFVGADHQQHDTAQRTRPERIAQIDFRFAVLLSDLQGDSAIGVAACLAEARQACVGSVHRRTAAVSV
jgi:hypothetical protein